MTARRGSRSRTSRGRGPDSIVKNTTSSFVAQMTTASLTAVLTVFLVRALGAKQYGLFALTIGMSSIAVAFADLGISSSTARFVAEHRGRDADLRALIADALKLKVIVTGLACALLAALASVIAGAYGNPELVWPLRAIALATFGQSTYLMLLGVSTARGRAIVNVRLVAAESLLEVSATVALVLAGAGAAGAAFGRAIGYVLGAVIAASVVLGLGRGGPVGFWRLPRRATVRLVGGYARSVFAIDASYTLSGSLSVLFLGAYAGSAASGIFQAPAKLITLIQYVGLSTANGVAPRLTRGPGQEPNVHALHGALRGLIGFQCLMLAPAVVWAGPITRVLLGPGYSRSADVLSALAPYIFFSGLAPLVTLSVNYLGEAGRRVPISLATLALVAAGGFILIPSHGVVGAAIATDIAFGFYTLAHIWLCRRLLKLRIGMLIWSLACGLTAASAMGIVLESVGTKHLTILDWLEGGAGGLTAYVAMLIFTREIRGAHIIRATAKVRSLLARLHLAPGPRRSPQPVMPPLPHRAAATSGIADSVWNEATPTDRTLSSTAVAEPADLAPGGASASIDRVEPPMERPGFVAPGLSRGHRSPAARPPEWMEGMVSEPAERVQASAPQRSPAAHPPAWLDENFGGKPVPSPGLGDLTPTDGADAALPDPRRRGPPDGDREPWGHLEPAYCWDDLVLPEPQLELLRAIRAELGARYRVGAAEGHAEDHKRGLMLLFRGGAGTGKTMAARLLGGELHLPIFQADLAAVFGRERAESEQVLGRLFAAGEHSSAVLALDHLDDLLIKRTPDARSGRPIADPEVSDLLRRSESHAGMVVFASQMPARIDQALLDRFDFVVDFPFPEEEARRLIWRKLLPGDARVPESDLEHLAHSFKLPGGAIENCCEAAAKEARATGVCVSTAHLTRALEHEYRGRLLSQATRNALALLRAASHAPGTRVEPPETRRPKAPAAQPTSPQPGNTSASRTDIVYQIAWRPDADAGVFELQPVEPSDTSEAPAAEQSPPVAWGWRIAPTPIPEARRAHKALVDRLLAAGWRRAGYGDPWFAHRFRSPLR